MSSVFLRIVSRLAMHGGANAKPVDRRHNSEHTKAAGSSRQDSTGMERRETPQGVSGGTDFESG